MNTLLNNSSYHLLFLLNLVVLTESRAAHPRLGLSPTFNLTKAIATSKANCTMGKVDIIDECGLMQGFSFRFQEALYPTNHESLLKDCKRQTDSLRCLKIYAKCLPPLTEGILMSMIGNRSKYNKKLCTETPSDVSRRFLEMNKCMQKVSFHSKCSQHLITEPFKT